MYKQDYILNVLAKCLSRKLQLLFYCVLSKLTVKFDKFGGFRPNLVEGVKKIPFCLCHTGTNKHFTVEGRC